jgi:hypothetical protein
VVTARLERTETLVHAGHVLSRGARRAPGARRRPVGSGRGHIPARRAPVDQRHGDGLPIATAARGRRRGRHYEPNTSR